MGKRRENGVTRPKRAASPQITVSDRDTGRCAEKSGVFNNPIGQCPAAACTLTPSRALLLRHRRLEEEPMPEEITLRGVPQDSIRAIADN
ncbi:hypothetical protein GCM10018965_006080 [Nonomuraea roseola]